VAASGTLLWLESLARFGIRPGLERMEAMLAELGDPQRAFAAIHVVGTNGKSTTTRMIEALLLDAGLAVGSTVSPHVRCWGERIHIGGHEVDFERAVARIRPAAERAGATQFEAVTAAAFAAFADAGVTVAVVEAGLGGRWDATNVVGAGVVVLTNIELDHTDLLGDTREAIAAEKLAVVRPGAVVVVGQPEWALPAREAGAVAVVVGDGSQAGDLAVKGAEAHLGAQVDPAPTTRVRLPGRSEWRGAAPAELWDGAHNPAGVDFLLQRVPPGQRFVVCCSILGDKGAGEMLERLAAAGSTLVATASSSPRALPAHELARLARGHFRSVETEPEPAAALARARELAGPAGSVLVTGSLYLLADLAALAAGPAL
jgi:dihydrofolate synthase/folylpolyglutamate synthase